MVSSFIFPVCFTKLCLYCEHLIPLYLCPYFITSTKIMILLSITLLSTLRTDSRQVIHSTYGSLRCYPCQMPSFHRKHPEKYFSRFVSHADSFSDSAVLLPHQIQSTPHRYIPVSCRQNTDTLLLRLRRLCTDCLHAFMRAFYYHFALCTAKLFI